MIGAEFERGTDGPRVIVVAVDGSTTSMRAAAYAAGLARRQSAELVVVFVAGIRPRFIEKKGDVYTEISKVCSAVLADAVVVGASTSAGHRLVGSLGVRLVRAGRWPVTVVP